MTRSLVSALALSSILTGQAYAIIGVQKTELKRIKGAREGVSPFIEHTLRPTLAGRTGLMEGLETEKLIAFDAVTGAARLVPSELLASYSLSNINQAELIRVGKLIVDENQSLFGLTSRDLVVNQGSILVDQDDQFISFDVLVKGLKVDDAAIQLRFKRGVLSNVVNSSYAEAEEDNRSAVSNLAQIARGSVLGTEVKEAGDSIRIVESGNGFKQIRVANFVVQGATDSFLVQVEKATGSLFEVKPSKLALVGSVKAQVYSSSYLDAKVAAPLHNLKVVGGSGHTDEKGSFQYSNPKSLAIPTLVGKYVEIKNLSGPAVDAKSADFSSNAFNFDFIGAVADKSGQNKQVAQVMSYYHINRIISSAQTYIKPTWFNAPVVSRVNVANTPGFRCNAYWERASGTINLLEHSDKLCANAALVADVSYHEWGHGLHQNAGGIKDRALSEGFGDVMAMLMTKSPKLGKGFLLDGRIIRDAEEVVNYPDPSGEEHRMGMSLSGAMWELFKALRAKHGEAKGTDIFAKLSFKMIFTAVKMTDAYQAVLNIDDDNAKIADGSPNYCLINKAFASRKLATLDKTACGSKVKVEKKKVM